MMTRKHLDVASLIRHYVAREDYTGWFEALYAQAELNPEAIPWAHMATNPYLERWIERERPDGSGKRALVVGCGLGDDAEALVDLGFAVTAFDISPSAISWCRGRFPESVVTYRVADLFDPPGDWQGRFDLVLESRTVQALPMKLWEQATENIANFLALPGTLLVICLARDPDGPVGNVPQPLSADDLQLFEKHGLTQERFEDYIDPDISPARRFRVTYRRIVRG
jgi:SAM-dependent methyltransferase